MDNAIAVPETQAVDAKALSSVEKARGMIITTAEDFKGADNFCVGLKELEKEIVSTFKDAKDKAFAAHRAVCAAEAKHLEPIQEARKIVKAKMIEWSDEQEKLRIAEEKRLQAEAKKKAEDDALAAAEAAEKSGDSAGAAEIIAQPVEVQAVVLPKETPKAQTVIRKVWTYRIVNANLVPRTYLTIDEKKLGQQARATQDTIKVPGVEFFQKPV